MDEHKYKSVTGWLGFWRAIAPNVVEDVNKLR